MERLELCGTKGKILAALQWLWMLIVVSEFLHWIMLCWPDHRNYYVVPLAILLLAACSLQKGRKSTINAAGVLFWVIAFLVGAVLISGIREIRWENLKPRWKMQTAYYVVVMLIPVMAQGMKPRFGNWKIPTLGIVVSVIISGVLSLQYVAKLSAPFYEMSRSLSLLGIGERFESLCAVGMTLGYFALMTYLLNITASLWGRCNQKRQGIWVSAAFVGMVFLSGMRMNSRLLAVGTLGIWVLLPTFEKITKNIKKPIDK